MFDDLMDLEGEFFSFGPDAGQHAYSTVCYGLYFDYYQGDTQFIHYIGVNEAEGYWYENDMVDEQFYELQEEIFEGTKYYPYPARELLRYIFELEAGELK